MSCHTLREAALRLTEDDASYVTGDFSIPRLLRISRGYASKHLPLAVASTESSRTFMSVLSSFFAYFLDILPSATGPSMYTRTLKRLFGTSVPGG